ncbi:hypothetical protein [Sphingomonas sp. DC1600-2]|uniref:hypothetical protein n=1 Tax=unclassified Sphingomonas TaxID=196159 RepID=UPI003CE90C3F
MGGAAAIAAFPASAKHPLDPIAHALAAAGGQALLSRVRVIAWSGTARMMIGRTPVDLMVETRIEPFARARSDTWLTSEGRSATQTIMVERDSAFLVHNGAQTSLPQPQAYFERQKLAAYSYLLLAPASLSPNGRRGITAIRDGYPPIALTLAPDGRIASADYTLAGPPPNPPLVHQHLLFAGTVSAQGIRFPRTTTILQNGRPVLRTTISDFSVELDPS